MDWRQRTRRGGALGASVMAACLVLLGHGTAFAQSANVGGSVTDQTGGALPGVTVTITNKNNGAVQSLVTGAEGNFRAVALQPAPYEIKAELSGFATVKRDVTLNVGGDLTVDLKLGVANLEEALTVTGESPLVEVAKAAPSSVVTADQIESLPVLSRNFLVLAQLLPGAAPYTGYKFAVTKFGGVADQRNGFTTLIDGGDVDDAIWGSPTINMTQDAVQEFKVFRNQFDAQYGSALSAVMSVVTKSGTNNYGGTGFFFGRNQSLNARNSFATTETPPYKQERGGGSFGGPISMNKTHFFTAFEVNNVDTVNIVALPAANPYAAAFNGQWPSGNSNQMADAKVDTRFSDQHSMFVRWAFDNQKTQGGSAPTATSVNDYSKSHSVAAEENWVMSNTRVNVLRTHILHHNVGTVPNNYDVNISRPTGSTGQDTTVPQYFPRTRVSLYDTLYINTPRHDFKVGGDITFASHNSELHFFEHGQFTFNTDAPFNVNDPRTWPISFQMQRPTNTNYKSKQIAAYLQDDWRIASRVRLNLGLRYDLDTNLRMNQYFKDLLANPFWAGLDRFTPADNRGNDYNNLQPRLGLTYDVRGNGSFVLRGASGLYVTRNRPYFEMTTMDRTSGLAVRIEDPQLLKNYPSIDGVLGGQSLESYLAKGGAKSVFMIGGDNVLPWAVNSTGGFGMQLNRVTSLDVDYVHQYGADQLGAQDMNLPAAGAITAANPRPDPRYTEVKVMQNFTKSWYDALETQVRTRVRGMDNLQISYTLSRSYRDGVNHYQTYRGTMRTPNEVGYSETDTRHNFSFAGSTTLPYKIQFSAIARAISGSPIPVSAGFDMDGDGQTQNDRPAGLGITVGRNNVEQDLAIINALRTSRNLPPITADQLALKPFVNVDLRLTKVVTLSARRHMEFFLEAFNATNTVILNNGSGTIINRTAFVPTTSRTARQTQLGARVVF
jgi:Carboxypeptidase regulatory-like domain/TonB dependent receptor-like, beta-barrel